MRWLGRFSRKTDAAAAPNGAPPANAQAARDRGRRSGGRTQVDRDLRAALLSVLDADYAEAERLISSALQIDSNAIDAYMALARLYRLRGELGRSIRIHQNLMLRPDLASSERLAALSELARDFHAGGFRERAIASYEEVLSQDKQNQQALEGLAELLADAGDFPRAIELEKRLAKQRGPASAQGEVQLLVRMAQREHEEGRSDAARKILKKATKRDPQNAEAFALLGEIEAERGKGKAALAAWSEAVKLDANVAAVVHPKLEATFASLGRAQDYETFLKKRLQVQPDDTTARLALSRKLAAKGEVDSALSELSALLDGQPHDLSARVALGRLLLDEHREPDALKEFSELLTVLEGPTQPAPLEPPE